MDTTLSGMPCIHFNYSSIILMLLTGLIACHLFPGGQEVLAGFILLLQPANAQWYSIFLLDEDIPCMANILGLPQESFKSILVMFGLGKKCKISQLQFLKDKFENFVFRHGLLL